mgnify:CR=1 FL=1
MLLWDSLTLSCSIFKNSLNIFWKFKDVIYKYNRFGVNEDPNDDGTLTYKFEYDILEIPEDIVNKKYADEEGKEFESLIGDILLTAN